MDVLVVIARFVVVRDLLLACDLKEFANKSNWWRGASSSIGFATIEMSDNSNVIIAVKAKNSAHGEDV